jgi:hypothetical protein
MAVLVSATACHALEVTLSPLSAQRQTGNKVTVYLYAANAVDLISMGVKMSFNPGIFQVVEARKYEDFNNGWVMDGDADSATADDRFTLPPVEIDNLNGHVVMIGGRRMGSQSAGLTSVKLPLGWIVFEAVGIGSSPLTVDLARYHPNDPDQTVGNFVRLDGQVDKPQPIPVEFVSFCVKTDACQSDATGDGLVNFVDLAVLRTNFGTNCSTLPPGTPCLAGFNGDGLVNFADLALLRQDFGRRDGLTCGP